MIQVKYKAQVTAIGPFVEEFLKHRIMVLFGQNAPEELAEFSILHDGTELAAPLTIGNPLPIQWAQHRRLPHNSTV